MHISVLPYDPNWSTDFFAIKSELAKALQDCEYHSIEHVGSTSVPGLPAKPVIDIDIIVSPAHLDATIDALTREAGYAYVGEQGIPDRHAFRKIEGRPPRNLYVCIDGCQPLRNHLAVRNTCRTDPKVRAEYARVKLELSQKEWRSVDEYCEAKNDVLYWVLEQAGLSREERDAIRKVNTDQ